MLRKTYPPAVTALDGVSLAVCGTIFGLLGPNGAGKSTTVRECCDAVTPDSGRALVAGSTCSHDPVGVRRAIGVVGQQHGVGPEATGRENLVLQGEFYGLTGRELRAARRCSRSSASTWPRPRTVLVKTYSGGMQRRLDIAMGLLHRPQVLFLDEPTTGLDPEARAEMWREIERLAAEERMTILLTTHYMDEADRLAVELAIIDRGRSSPAERPDQLKGELHGDALQVELADPDGRGRAAPRSNGVDGLDERRGSTADVSAPARGWRRGDPGRARCARGARRDRAASVTLARPSLDDVYLRHAGRAFEADETQEEAA